MSRTILSCICAMLFAGQVAAEAVAETTLSDTLSTDTLTVAKSPYHVKGPLTLLDGDTLTIEAGVEVVFDTTVGLKVEGLLLAIGADGTPITFTVDTDSADYWTGIALCGGDTSKLSWVQIEGAGGDVSQMGGVTVSSDTTEALVSNCTFTGNTPSAGGAVNLVSGWLKMDDCSITANSTGIRTWGGTLEATNLTITDNTASGVVSGGGTTTFLTSTITDNRSAGNGAGANITKGTVSFTNCDILRNKTTANGGGLYAGGTTTLNTCAISADSATNGGGIYVAGTVDLTGCTVASDTAAMGGGVYVGGGSLSVNACMITDNTALNGGAFAAVAKSFSVTRSLIARNAATDTIGGAIYLVGNKNSQRNTVTLVNCTMVGNSAAAGRSGAIFLGSKFYNELTKRWYTDYSAAVIENCIAWDNGANPGVKDDDEAGGFTVSYSDIEGEVVPGKGNISEDPLFEGVPAKLSRSSEAMPYSLGVGSPCIDTGSPYKKDADDSRSDMGYTGGDAAQESIPRLEAPDSITVKRSRAATLVVSNTGWADLTVDSIQVPKRFTTTFEGPAVVAVGATLDIPLTFTPAVDGDTSATAAVWSDDLHNLPANVLLKGYAGVDVAEQLVSATWTADESPYYVASACTLGAGEVLTIEPGVDVIFADSARMVVQGAVMAPGLAASKINFALVKEDSFGWAGLEFAGPDSSSMTFVTFSGFAASPTVAGGGAVVAVNGTGARLAMSWCSVSDSTVGRNGVIRVMGGNLHMSNITINGCSSSTGGVVNASGGKLFMDKSSVLGSTCDGVSIANALATISGSTISGSAGHGINAGGNSILDLSGTTIEDNATTGNGGGILFTGVDLWMEDCVIDGNTAADGAGAWLGSGTLEMEGCTFSHNIADSNAGGLAVVGRNVKLRGCFITDNKAQKGVGGGVYLQGNLQKTAPKLVMYNCTIAGNRSETQRGGGIFLSSLFYNDFMGTNFTDKSSMALTDCIIWLNGPDGVVKDSTGYGSQLAVYSDIQGSGIYPGEGNIKSNPLFVDASNGDYMISGGSPCIDTGSPVSNLDPDGTRSDMGAVPGKAYLGVALDEGPKAEQLLLAQNAPNPFNPMTTISFTLPEASGVKLVIYNLQGQRVRTLLDGHRSAGTHSAVWNGTDAQGRAVASGLYLYRLTDGTNTLVRRMMLVR